MLGIRHYKNCAVDLWQGDITTFVCDAMVNAANTKLCGGGGVDGAIHTAGGPTILEECRKIGGCKIGDAVSTGAGNLPCKWVIHTVGPVWKGGHNDEHTLLASAYMKSFLEGEKLGVRHIAFSAISTGVYKYPLDEAAMIAVNEAKTFLDETSGRKEERKIKRITFVLYNKPLYDYFQKALFSTFPDPQ